MEGKPFQTHPGIVGEGPAVAVQVLIRLVVIVLFHPHDHAVAHKGPDAAGMGIVRGADPRKGRIVPVLVMIDPLPGAVRIVPQRVPDFDHRLQRRQGQDLVRHRGGRDRPGGDFQKLST